MKSFAAVLGLGMAAVVAAIPANYTVTPITGDECSVYPGYDASTGIAGPWTVQVNHTGSAIDNHGMTIVFSRGSTAIRWGAIAALNDISATNPLRCQQGHGIQGLVPSGVSGYTWEDLRVTTYYPYDAEFMYFVGGVAVQPYRIAVDGVDQGNVYFGVDGVVAWGWTPYESQEFGKYWLARLLGPNSQDPTTGAPLKQGEVVGFMKIYQ